QQYGAERLVESGETDQARSRHAAWLLALAEQAEAELRGPREAAWSGRLEDDNENLRGALRWLIDRGQAEPALRLGSALWRFWTLRGHLVEGLVWLEQILALTGEDGDTDLDLLRAGGRAERGWQSGSGARR